MKPTMKTVTTDNEYEAQAQMVATSLGLTVKLAFKGDRCPPWRGGDNSYKGQPYCGQCGVVHGARYRVTLRFGPYEPDDCPIGKSQHTPPGYHARTGCFHPRRPRVSLSFDFWGSYHDKTTGKRPGVYDVLAVVSADADNSVDPDEINRECGPMAPSQAVAIAKHSARLKAFFTSEELTTLQELQ